MGVRGQRNAPAALPPEKTRYPLYRRLGGPQGRSRRVRKILPSTGIRSPDRPARSESLYRLSYPRLTTTCLFIFIIIFLHGLGTLNCSGIDALPSFPGASTISSSSVFVVESLFRESGVVHSLKVVDPILFVFGSYILHSRDLQLFSYDFASYFIQPCVSRNTS